MTTTPRALRSLVEDLVATLGEATRAVDANELQLGLFRLALDAPEPGSEPGAARSGWLCRHASAAAVAALRKAVLDAATPGAAYQELLGIRLRRLDGAGICSPSGSWLLLDEILREPPAARSRFIQRMAALPKSRVSQLAGPLSRATGLHSIQDALLGLPGWGPVQPLGALVVDTSPARRRSGAHYTPPALAAWVVERTLGPLVEGLSSRGILGLRICDPAMGDGVFLDAAARFLSARFARALESEGLSPQSLREAPAAGALRDCLYGVDHDPIAVHLATRALRAAEGGENQRETADDQDLLASGEHLAAGNALVGSVRAGLPGVPTSLPAFDWHRAFPEVFSPPRDGFDAVVGNPPWVAYAGRAAQPLRRELFDYYRAANPAFGGYRTLHGLFVFRAAELLRPGGRLGLLLPTSVADLAGYGPVRTAHDSLCQVDPEIEDLGDGAFSGVFQPCMALTSTRRERGSASPRAKTGKTAAPWPLSRPELDRASAELLGRLSALPPLPGELFGERGFQTSSDDLAYLRRSERPESPYIIPLRQGGDVTERELSAPTLFADPTRLSGRLRATSEFDRVAIVLRQTARYPIAAISDGLPFRNSLLAAFESDDWPRAALELYLNSTAIRWYHYTRHRDARQGMPQLKVGHLRSLPSLADGSDRRGLEALARRLPPGRLSAKDREAVDTRVFDALAFSPEERVLALAWHTRHPLPVRRGAPALPGRKAHR